MDNDSFLISLLQALFMMAVLSLFELKKQPWEVKINENKNGKDKLNEREEMQKYLSGF